jgi:hypothetical protein
MPGFEWTKFGGGSGRTTALLASRLRTIHWVRGLRDEPAPERTGRS